MTTMKAYRIEQDFRRVFKAGRLGRVDIQWDMKAAPHMDGVTFKAGYLIVMYVSNSEILSGHYHTLSAFRPTMELEITESELSRLCGEKLVRELV